MLAGAPGVVEHTPDTAKQEYGLVPCKWLGPASHAALLQRCGGVAGRSLKKLLRKPERPLPIIVVKKTVNSMYPGVGDFLARLEESETTTVDATSFKDVSINWKVRALVFVARNPLDSGWSVLKREYDTTQLEKAFTCTPCEVRSHFREAWHVLRELGLLAVASRFTRVSLLAHDIDNLGEERDDAAGRSTDHDVLRGTEAKEGRSERRLGPSVALWAAFGIDPDAAAASHSPVASTEDEASFHLTPKQRECWSMARSYSADFQRDSFSKTRAFRWAQQLEASPQVTSLLPAMVVRYEDLASNPQSTLQAICAYLQSREIDLKFNDRMINTTANPLSRSNLGLRVKPKPKEQLAQLQRFMPPKGIIEFNEYRVS